MAYPSKTRDPDRVRAFRAVMMIKPGVTDSYFRALYAEGLVDGWSNIIAAGEPLDTTGHFEQCGPFHTGRECCR